MADLALFDFDGTITVKDTFTPFIYYAVDPLRLRWGKLLLAPMIVGYKLGLIPASRIRATIVRIGFRGRNGADIQQLGFNYMRKLTEVVRPQALERIRWHQARGDVVTVVSASLDAYLTPWCQQLGVDLLCTQLETRDGRLTGRYLHGDCTGDEKAKRIGAKYDLPSFAQIYAYGDTAEDAPMLNLASKKFYRWHQVDDVSAAVAAHVTSDPNRHSRLSEIAAENEHLERLIAED